jgi:peptide/nickel transport system permease protein
MKARLLPMQAKGSPRQVEAQTLLRLFLHSKEVIIGGVVVASWVLCAAAGGLIAPQDPFAINSAKTLASPSFAHLFGTDKLGRDVLSRVVSGSRDILTVAPLATLTGVVCGTALGLVMGYYRGAVDAVVGRALEAVLALPTVVVALLALAAFGPSNLTVMLVIGFVFTPYVARTVRTGALAEREQEYVEAAFARGEKSAHIMIIEILPNVLPLVLVEATVRLGYAIFAVATLSFIGFGIQPPSPDWGLSMADNYGLINGGYWWPTLFPAMAIASLVVGVNLLADGIGEVLDR